MLCLYKVFEAFNPYVARGYFFVIVFTLFILFFLTIYILLLITLITSPALRDPVR